MTVSDMSHQGGYKTGRGEKWRGWRENFHSIFIPLFLFCTYPGTSYPKLSHSTIFTVCSLTFTLFWLRKTSVIVETYQLSFCVFIWNFHPEISVFSARVSCFHSYFCVICTSVLSLSTWYICMFQMEKEHAETWI